ncbi:hypothetical protein FB45DRAFT_1056450 [Roridomyces roridus]|uniref:Nephrocystin 3-like N-terminal domain-containing protein n=1 Tax=Roridomyces roridus TaxID=1738132 RepID=A0AAD7BZX1_9AGAR|nr:hypothetical protein FB45DRAFT_1056450 [Roridomyces roridus]
MSLYQPHQPDSALLPHSGGNNPVHIQNSTFNSVAGNMNVSHTTNVGEGGLDVLRRALCEDAMHDSAVRPPDPSCHPGTRNAILERLDQWSFEQPEDSRILWLHGCAGIGKSAIAQQFAASCQARGQLGGSFFWKRGDQIDAYQLEKLFVLPFKEAQIPRSRPILVLDGLDECESHAIQTMLLQSFIDVVRSRCIPIHILICSRSESHLREVLEAPDNSDLCGGFQIRPDPSAYADISRFLTHEFSRIHRAHTGRGIALDDGWPGKATIQELVERSSGTFIYAATIVRWVDDEYSHPEDRLGAVLSLDPLSTTPLDDLYIQILSAIPDESVLVRVLHAILEAGLGPEDIDTALQMRRGTSRSTLRGLHSLLQVPSVRILDPEIQPVQLLHASFGDFLVDPQRSSGFCVSGEELRIVLVHSMICALESGLQPLDFRTIASSFLRSLIKIPPTESLFPILRDVYVQHRAYTHGYRGLADSVLTWLKRYSNPPSDLVETWVDLCRLIDGSYLHYFHDHRIVEFLGRYLSKNPASLAVFRIASALRDDQYHPRPERMALDLLGLTWEVFRPLLKFSLDNLCNFLRDPQRCEALYMSPREILHSIALLCISRMSDVLRTNNFFEFDPMWISGVRSCKPDGVLFGALGHLELSQACGKLKPDKEYHLKCHEREGFLSPDSFETILEWLRKWPSTPPHIIQSWERQKTAAQECHARLRGQPTL